MLIISRGTDFVLDHTIALQLQIDTTLAGGVGFEPTTTSLGGLRPILTGLPALRMIEETCRILAYCSQRFYHCCSIWKHACFDREIVLNGLCHLDFC